MKAIVLAAGYATRLYPLTKDRPKPLLIVGKKPIIEHIVDKIKSVQEVDEIFIVTNHRFYPLFQAWLRNYPQKEKIKIIDDGTLTNDDRLGAIGDFYFVLREEMVKDDVMLIAGDNLFSFKLKAFLDFFKKNNSSSLLAVYDLKQKEKLVNRFGVVLLDKSQRLIDFEEKPAEPKSTLAATSCYIFSKKELPCLSEYIGFGNKKDNPGDFAKWFLQKNKLYGFVFKEPWFDIGSFEGLEEANKLYRNKQF